MKFKLSILSLLTVALLTVCSFGQNGPANLSPANVTLKEAYISLPGGATAIYGSAGTLQYYRHTDGLGNTTLVSPSTAPYSATTSVNTAPFGEDFDDSCGTCSNSMYDFSFSDMGQDDATQGGIGAGYGGLYGTPNRTYSAVQGRWLSPDPVVGGNAYVYASNAPVVNSDPTGLQDGWDCSDDSCDVWLSWGWGDDGGYGGYWDWGWGGWGWSSDPSMLSPDVLGSSGWWSSTNGTSSYFTSYIAEHPYSTATVATGSIEATVYVNYRAEGRFPGGQVCVSGCSNPTNAGETAEMRSQRYMTNFSEAALAVASMFNGGQFESAIEINGPFNFTNLRGAAVEWREVESLPSWNQWGRIYLSPMYNKAGEPILLANGERGFSLYLEDLDGMGLTKISNHYGYLGLDGTLENSTSSFALRGLDDKLLVAPNEFKTFPFRGGMKISHAYFNDMEVWSEVKFKYLPK
jgi:RHS repeat-associated protein